MTEGQEQQEQQNEKNNEKNEQETEQQSSISDGRDPHWHPPRHCVGRRYQHYYHQQRLEEDLNRSTMATKDLRQQTERSPVEFNSNLLLPLDSSSRIPRPTVENS